MVEQETKRKSEFDYCYDVSMLLALYDHFRCRDGAASAYDRHHATDQVTVAHALAHAARELSDYLLNQYGEVK